MKISNCSISQLTGEQAYLIFWIAKYDCQVKLSTVTALHDNLEVIMNDEGELLAYRYDDPDELKGLVKGTGEWQYFSQNDALRNRGQKNLHLTIRMAAISFNSLN